MEWKWTKGEPYERTKRQYRVEDIIQEEVANDQKIVEQIEKSAYTSSLNHDENTWDILNQGFIEDSFRQINKREDTDRKLAERQLIGQVNMNPYLTNNNYLDDVSARDTYLKPQATNLDREKNQEYE